MSQAPLCKDVGPGRRSGSSIPQRRQVALGGAGSPAGAGRSLQGLGAKVRAQCPASPALTVHLRVRALLVAKGVLGHLPGLRAYA